MTQVSSVGAGTLAPEPLKLLYGQTGIGDDTSKRARADALVVRYDNTGIGRLAS
jgi:hypothetical protein